MIKIIKMNKYNYKTMEISLEIHKKYGHIFSTGEPNEILILQKLIVDNPKMDIDDLYINTKKEFNKLYNELLNKRQIENDNEIKKIIDEQISQNIF